MNTAFKKLLSQFPVRLIICLALISLISIGCAQKEKKIDQSTGIPVIFDTDANNELDDQHALAYLLFNQATFKIKGVTVNATYNGGEIQSHYDEAARVMTLCGDSGQIPLIKGANASFNNIKSTISDSGFDGQPAVDFIISEAKKLKDQKLVVLAVGKLTNVALAVLKEPSIVDQIRLVWLGSNYPEPGEYNLDNDIASLNYLLQTDIEFEMVTVRYGKPSGTDAVKVYKNNIKDQINGLGPKINSPVTGRHGGQFNCFGDYAVSLFEHAEFYGDPPGRSLFDMAAVAIVKNPDWAKRTVIDLPLQYSTGWTQDAKRSKSLILWEEFDKKAILDDFFSSLKQES